MKSVVIKLHVNNTMKMKAVSVIIRKKTLIHVTSSNLQFLSTPSQDVALISFNGCLNDNPAHLVTQTDSLICYSNKKEKNVWDGFMRQKYRV